MKSWILQERGNLSELEGLNLNNLFLVLMKPFIDHSTSKSDSRFRMAQSDNYGLQMRINMRQREKLPDFSIKSFIIKSIVCQIVKVI